MEIAYSRERMYCLGWVISIHMALVFLMRTVLKDHTMIAASFIIALPLMYRVYWGTFEPRTRKRAIKQKFKERIRKNFKTAAGREKLYLDTLYGILISFSLFLVMLVGQYFFGYQLCTNTQGHHDSFYFYLLLSVPGQQLLFFIWPQMLSEHIVPRPVAAAASVLLFGHLHSYYPELITPILAGVVLGIPSAILTYYFKNPISAMICHAIIGSAGLLLGLV